MAKSTGKDPTAMLMAMSTKEIGQMIKSTAEVYTNTTFKGSLMMVNGFRVKGMVEDNILILWEINLTGSGKKGKNQVVEWWSSRQGRGMMASGKRIELTVEVLCITLITINMTVNGLMG
jgi:hypothetical protein